MLATALSIELPGLFVSVLALLVVVFWEHLIRQGTEAGDALRENDTIEMSLIVCLSWPVS